MALLTRGACSSRLGAVMQRPSNPVLPRPPRKLAEKQKRRQKYHRRHPKKDNQTLPKYAQPLAIIFPSVAPDVIPEQKTLPGAWNARRLLINNSKRSSPRRSKSSPSLSLGIMAQDCQSWRRFVSLLPPGAEESAFGRRADGEIHVHELLFVYGMHL